MRFVPVLAGVITILIAFGSGSSALAIGGVALTGLGVAVLGSIGPWPLGGRLALAGLGVAAVGLAGFALSAVGIELHPAAHLASLALLVSTAGSVAVTGVGSILIGASAIRVIVGPRPTSVARDPLTEGAGPGLGDPGRSPSSRVRRVPHGLIALAAATVLVGLTGYTAYVGAIGSDQLLNPSGNPDCRTPLVRYSWTYEAINYDIADDTDLQARNPDMASCAGQGATAGNEVVTADGARIAGWYIPAANGMGPTGPTVVLVHGWGANKSEVLRYAVPLHATFNVVAFDLRDGGRSGPAESTFGLREQLDVEAIIDWLARTKHPVHIAVMGNSMGGGAATLAAAADPRIEALILDSTHAHVADILERRLEVDAGHPALPGTPAILAGILVRTGLDLVDADPIGSISALGQRPLLLLHGTADAHDLPARSVDAMYQAAQAAGVPVERHMCPGATHGRVIDTCPTEWGQWAVAFLIRAFHMTS